MSIIKDTFFGGAEKKAAKAQQKGIEKGIASTQAATAQARQDLGALFPQARQDLQQGFQGALDVFQSVVPQQSNIFQQGNIGAQQAILAGLPQFQNAILGGQIDYGAFQPSQQFQPDFSFLNQNIAPPQGVAQFGDAPTQFNGRMGPFQDTGSTLTGAVGSGGLNRSKGNFLLSHMNRN